MKDFTRDELAAFISGYIAAEFDKDDTINSLSTDRMPELLAYFYQHLCGASKDFMRQADDAFMKRVSEILDDIHEERK